MSNQSKHIKLDVENAKQPSLGSYTPETIPETIPSNMLEKLVNSAPIYSHWFALEMYEQYTNLQLQPNKPSQITINDISVTTQPETIKTFVENFKAIMSIPPICEIKPGMNDNNLKSTKMTLTAMLAQAFDGLLFHDADIGACLHQLPVKANDSVLVTPDLCVIEKQRDNLPGRLILLSTFSYGWLCDSEMKSIAYSIRAMEASAGSEEFVLQLCLVLTPDKAKLQVHVGQHEKIMKIDVCEINMMCSSQLERFCCLLRGVVHSLIKKPVHTLPCITPLCNVQLTNYLSGYSPYRVFHSRDNNVVYKLYDTELDTEVPNVEIIKEIREDYLPGLSLIMLSSDNRYQCLCYTYIKGTSRPKNVCQFAEILKALHKIHQAGYVHGDMRKVNLLFGETKDEAWIIDFDFAGIEGSCYPEDYNPGHLGYCEIEERHTTAGPGLPRMKEHDRYALHVIMTKISVASRYTNIVDKLLVSQNDLLSIAEEIEQSCL